MSWSYNKGNAVYCAGFGEGRFNVNLWNPIGVEVTVDETNRTYTITANYYLMADILYSYYVAHRSVNLFGVGKGDISVSTNDRTGLTNEPGVWFTSQTMSGTYNDDGTPSTASYTINGSYYISYYTNTSHTATRRADFSNSITVTVPNIDPIATPPDTPTMSNLTAYDTKIEGSLAVSSYGVGYEGGNKMYALANTDPNFEGLGGMSSLVVDELSGDFIINNLVGNTKYYVKPRALNGIYATDGVVQEIITKPSVKIDKVSIASLTSISVSASVQEGGGELPITTYIEISEDGSTWTTKGTTTDYNINEIITGLTSGEHYSVRARSVTTAGETISNIIDIDLPEHLFGNILEFSNDELDVTVKLKGFSDASNNLTISLYYRIAGVDETWTDHIDATAQVNEEISVVVQDIVPNVIPYEFYAHFEDGAGNEYDTAVETYTPEQAEHTNYTKENLYNLLQYICQTYNAIKNGEIDIYANKETKEVCEINDNIPSHAAIMTRVRRFMQALATIAQTVNVTSASALDGSREGQVFTGDIGWTDMDNVPTENSQKLVKSGGIKDAIDDVISSVWHYVGDYDYFANNPLELNAQTGSAGKNAIMGNKLYKWENDAWVEDETITPENFGVIHINEGRYADKAFYWVYSKWHRLDMDLSEYENAVSDLESQPVVVSFDNNKYNIAMVDKSLTDAQIDAAVPTVANKTTIILITEEANNG